MKFMIKWNRDKQRCFIYDIRAHIAGGGRMTYRLPEKGGGDREMLCEYVREHRENGETDISASHGLTDSEYSEWVGKIHKNASEGDGTWGKSLLYLCLEGGRLIGLLSIRYGLPEELSRKYGHIGFGVRPSERKKVMRQPCLNMPYLSVKTKE